MTVLVLNDGLADLDDRIAELESLVAGQLPLGSLTTVRQPATDHSGANAISEHPAW